MLNSLPVVNNSEMQTYALESFLLVNFLALFVFSEAPPSISSSMATGSLANSRSNSSKIDVRINYHQSCMNIQSKNPI